MVLRLNLVVCLRFSVLKIKGLLKYFEKKKKQEYRYIEPNIKWKKLTE